VKAGILSDSHDHREGAAGALDVFLREGVRLVLHLGDVCSPALLEPIRACGIPLLGVFGNNDADRSGLQAVSGNGFRRGPHSCEIGGRRILMSHSFDELQGEIGEGGKFDLILFGHTHRPLTMRVGRALVINPGEACGFVSGTPTCAVIDLATMDARILPAAKGTRAPGAAGGGRNSP
jgi:putative phosphoesterase